MAVARRSAVTLTAVYCTVPPPRDPDQTPVDQQEKQCRATARERGLVVPPNLVFVDTVRAGWQPGHTRPGWESLIEAMAPRRFGTLIVYRPEWQLRRPADLLALLTAIDTHRIVLIAHCSGWDLSDAAFRRELRGRAAKAERNAERVSQQARADHARAADVGRAHGGGLRAFGYAPGLAAIIEHEAVTIREIYAQYLANTGPRAIARALNARGITTALGGDWTPSAVTRILDAPRYAGIRIFQGRTERIETGGYRLGMWPPIVTIEQWENVRALRQAAAVASRASRVGSSAT
jgi:DNA invertase Pin-like site-specific DNA recombinase